MRPIERALDEIRALHEQITRSMAPGSASQGPEPIPAGIDPVVYTLQEVARLRQAVEHNCAASRPEEPVQWVPRASVFSGATSARVVLDIPGVAREEVAITFTSGELVVRGDRRPPVSEEEFEPVVVEQFWGKFERRFPLPEWCRPELISAHCANGVLEIELRRGNETKPVEFQVEID